ncbi:MAG TPA: prepilin-type N-terminal cleavage/methylation domain-containing protein, partial [Gemmatimonadales bacterium]|nr:prepilin-type N-terminal cleavage/methylation domain-containing protein [Gemmatimonadales bacterium]
MLTTAGRRGFTLVEIMVAMTIMLIVGGAVFKLLVTSQRVARGQAERAALQSNVRAGSIVVLNDLRELNGVVGGTADQNDVLNVAADAITYRGMRGVGFVCEEPTATQIRIARNGFSAYRDPQPGRDGVYVFIEGDPESQLDDAWIRVAVTGVSTAAACPGTAGPAITLTVPSTAALAGVALGTPVRIFEVMELKLYQSDGRSWLGARSVSAGEAI